MYCERNLFFSLFLFCFNLVENRNDVHFHHMKRIFINNFPEKTCRKHYYDKPLQVKIVYKHKSSSIVLRIAGYLLFRRSRYWSFKNTSVLLTFIRHVQNIVFDASYIPCERKISSFFDVGNWLLATYLPQIRSLQTEVFSLFVVRKRWKMCNCIVDWCKQMYDMMKVKYKYYYWPKKGKPYVMMYIISQKTNQQSISI